MHVVCTRVVRGVVMPRRGSLSGKDFAFASEFDSLLWRTGTSLKAAAQVLRRDVRTVRDWRTGKRPCPRWAFQLLYFTRWRTAESWLGRVRHLAWVDLREFTPGEPLNDPVFLEAMRSADGTGGAGAHAVPNPVQPGRTVGPSGAHGGTLGRHGD